METPNTWLNIRCSWAGGFSVTGSFWSLGCKKEELLKPHFSIEDLESWFKVEKLSVSCIFMQQKLEHKGHLIKCWPLIALHSHRNQKESKNLIGLCARTLSSSVSLLHTHIYTYMQVRTHSQTHTHHVCITTHPQTSTISFHAHTHTHLCHNHLYAKWLAATGCYGCRYQVVWQETASCFTLHLCQFKVSEQTHSLAKPISK